MRNMRLAKREVTETEALRQILEDCDVVRLGLTDEDGMFIVSVNFGYELSEENGARKLQLYIHSAKEGRKAEAFVKHPVAALEMDCGHEVITDEPGIYIEGSHGIRLENELLICEGEKNEYGQFMYTEPITFVPMDLDAIDPEQMSAEDKKLLNDYHKKVYEVVSPYLEEDEKEWLKTYTREI